MRTKITPLHANSIILAGFGGTAGEPSSGSESTCVALPTPKKRYGLIPPVLHRPQNKKCGTDYNANIIKTGMWSKSATVLSKTRLRHFFRDMPYPSKTFRTPKSTREKCLETCLTRKNSPAAGFTAHVLTCFRRVLAARAYYQVRTLRRAFFQIKRERRLFRTRRFLSGQIFRLEFFIGAKSFVDIVVIGVCVLLVSNKKRKTFISYPQVSEWSNF